MHIRPAKRALSLAVLILPLLAGRAWGHPTGTSKIDAVLATDSLQLRIDVNSAEVLNLMQVKDGAARLNAAERENLSERIALYFQSRIKVTQGGLAVGASRVVSWSKDTLNAGKKMDSLGLEDTTYVMKIAWPIDPDFQKLEIQASLFAELGIQAICQLSLFWRDTLVKRRWLDVDDRLTLDIHPDSLHAMATSKEAEGGSAQPPPSGNIFSRFIWLGFTHIVPHGLDHVLFVLGLFLFSTRMRPLLIQVTAFTLAHSITLGLAMFGIFSLPGRLVEPLIALSIAVVALENIFFRKLRPSRWIIVFAFGLVHGLGFAGVLMELGLVKDQFLTTLVGFNLGVELGQLAVITGAAALTMWVWKKTWYYRYVVVPASLLTAGVGLFWAVERLMSSG